MPDHPEAPAWFRRALAVQPGHGEVKVEGARIHYLHWGERGRPGIVFVHGGAAHAHWWSFIAPLLLPHHHVVAVDLAGHGESGRRPVYAIETWADEVMAAAEDSGMSAPPVLVGHSMGGLVAIAAGSLHGERLAGVVVVDSPVRRPDPESEEGERGRMFRNPKVYADLETAVAHFHLAPPQP